MAAGVEAFKYSGEAPPGDPAWRVAIVLGPSRLALAWIAAVALAATAAVLASDLPASWRAALSATLAALAVRAARRDGLRSAGRAVRRFAVDPGGRVEAWRTDGCRLEGRLAPGCFVSPWLVVVCWRPAGARLARTILVAPDAVAAEPFRRLRVLLRWR